jgi:hypothetical protein
MGTLLGQWGAFLEWQRHTCGRWGSENILGAAGMYFGVAGMCLEWQGCSGRSRDTLGHESLLAGGSEYVEGTYCEKKIMASEHGLASEGARPK